MPLPETLTVRLSKGLVRIDAQPPGGSEAEALGPLRRSLVRTIARLDPGNAAVACVFHFRLTGGRPLLFQGTNALPLEPDRLSQLLLSMGVELDFGEDLDLDGGVAAWLIRPELSATDTKLRQAEDKLRGLRLIRDRDVSLLQTTETLKIRLRSRLTQLVGALQAAQGDIDANAPAA